MPRLTYLILIFILLISGAVVTQEVTVREIARHKTADGFRNVFLEDPQKTIFHYLYVRLFGDTEWADHASRADEVPVLELDAAQLHLSPEGLRVSWLGHSTFLLQQGEVNILTDPVFSDRTSPLSFAGPARYVPHVVDYAALPAIDYVIISHNHYDHLDEATIRMLGNGPEYLVPLGLQDWFVDKGINAGRVHEMDWWQQRALDRVTVTAMPSQHWSSRGLFDRMQTLWASWLVELDGTSVWFAGDTGYNPIQFREIGEKTGGVDLALIPIGGYLPRSFMGPYHVNPEEAIRIHRDVRARRSIGMHWGTFPLTAEGPIDPLRELEKQRRVFGIRGSEFMAMAVGEVVEFD